jgi:hypothetical protein
MGEGMLPTLHYLFFPNTYMQDGDKSVKKISKISRPNSVEMVHLRVINQIAHNIFKITNIIEDKIIILV